jgi:hypothetical protein
MRQRINVSVLLRSRIGLDAEVDINSAWETIRENIKSSLKKSPVLEPRRKGSSSIRNLHQAMVSEDCNRPTRPCMSYNDLCCAATSCVSVQ